VCVGIWLRADPTFHQFVDVNNEFNFVFSAAYVTISVGVVVAAIGALGLCGAICHNVCILVTVIGTFIRRKMHTRKHNKGVEREPRDTAVHFDTY